MDDGGTT